MVFLTSTLYSLRRGLTIQPHQYHSLMRFIALDYQILHTETNQTERKQNYFVFTLYMEKAARSIPHLASLKGYYGIRRGYLDIQD